jgi:DNA-binding MarR family transcriptional regulator
MTAPTPDLENAPRRSPRLAEELLSNTMFLVAKVGFACKARAVEEFERAGFSMYHYSVLALLGEQARETQATIADALQVDRSQLVGVLDTLEERGLIDRKRDPSDRRRHTVSLTAEGERELVRLRGIAKSLEREFLAPLDEQSRAALHGILLRLALSDDCC